MITAEHYYNPNKLMSYDRLLNFVIGARGIGKTYGWKMFCVKRFIKQGEMFIYCKRYRSDLKGADQFFDSIKTEFPDHEFRVDGHDLKIDGKLAGWIIPLSAWQSIKSREFPQVGTIIYDEFMLEKSSNQRYMDEEPKALMNFMDTVFRNRDNVRCVCLSNAVSIANPYFVYFDLVPDINKRFNKYKNIVVEVPESKDFSEERKQTKLGRLIDDTEYGKFSLGNEFVNDTETFIEKRSKYARYQFSLVYKGMTLGVWVDTEEGLMYLSGDHDPNSKKVFALTKDDLEENRYLMDNWRKIYPLMKMVSAFKRGWLRFDNQVIRTLAYDMFKHMNIR